MKKCKQVLNFSHKRSDNCLQAIHFCILAVIFLYYIIVTKSFALEKQPYVRIPASMLEEVMTVPLDDHTFTNENLFPEDDAGILKGMRETVGVWDKKEEFARNWNLESTGIYKTPSAHEKQKFITAKVLRYADKRLSGEMKKAEEGSTLYRVGKIEKNLRPNSQVPINKYVSLKFKARVLQGKAIVEVKNPWVEFYASAAVNGRARVVGRKEFKNTGTSSGMEYGIDDAQMLAYVDQQITAEVKARLSSSRYENTNIFGNDADKKVEIVASFPFNF